VTQPQTSFDAWIGRFTEAEDVVAPRLVAAFQATLAPHLAPCTDGIAPLGLHWCLAPALTQAGDIGTDGLATVGDFMPPVELPRRMWASGKVEFLAPLRIGDHIRRRSSIDAISHRQGRSGPLCFVTVLHEIENERGPVIREDQVIVYRGSGEAPPEPATPPIAKREGDWTVAIDPVLLFRYSALTFNGHRIHYDTPYATDVEGYPGLVVHGPLQATLAGTHKRAPAHFAFRGVRAATGCAPLSVGAEPGDGTSLNLAIHTRDGLQTMQAKAGW
jgi:3-methylfumaryl-CoA hydratase